MAKTIARELINWIMAILCSVFVLNIFTFLFFHPVHELVRHGGASPGLKVPYQWSLYGTEGWGIQTIDAMGYPNPSLPLENEYICLVGTSHMEGLHSQSGERASDILNERMGFDNSLYFYNIAHSGYDFDNIARHFPGIIQEFPNMEALIIEIRKTDYTVEQLNYALDQVGYSAESDSVESLMDQLSNRDRLIIRLKDYFPLFRLLTNQYATYRDTHNGNVSSSVDFDYSDYQDSLDRVMELIRSEYNGDIIIVYHPETCINSDGTIQICYNETDAIFEATCERHMIGFIDMGPYFEMMYYNDGYAAYGFGNTTLMTGHLNRYGHRIMADAIYDFLYGES